MINWQTGTPTETDKYLITHKGGVIRTDWWYDFNKEWATHYNEDVIAWCKLTDIQPYKPQ